MHVTQTGKRTLIISGILLGCLLQLIAYGQAGKEEGGIKFFNGTWAQVLEQSKVSGKPIFVDVYTSWCLPCRKMEQEIFPAPAVAELFNTSFINYRINAEVGEGPQLKEKYNVGGYPTFLFIKSNEELISRGIGYNEDPAVFIEKGSNALLHLHDTLTLEKLQEQYVTNKNDKEVVRKYIVKLNELNVPLLPDTLLHRYFLLLSDKELLEEKNQTFLLRYVKNINDTVFNYILLHQSLISDDAINNVEIPGAVVTGKRRLGLLLSNLVLDATMKSIQTMDLQLLQLAQEKAQLLKHTSLKFPYTLFAFSTQTYARAKDTANLVSYAQHFLDPLLTDQQLAALNKQQYKDFLDPYLNGMSDSTKIKDFNKVKAVWKTNFTNYYTSLLNLGAISFAGNIYSAKNLASAIIWSRYSLKLSPNNPEYLNTLAALYYRLGDRNNALHYQQQSVAQGNEQQIDLKALERFKERLTKMENGTPL